jgi:hypothetical protein
LSVNTGVANTYHRKISHSETRIWIGEAQSG